MRTLVHLSDLHFGRTDADVVAALPGTVASIRPDVVVVSSEGSQESSERSQESE